MESRTVSLFLRLLVSSRKQWIWGFVWIKYFCAVQIRDEQKFYDYEKERKDVGAI